MRSRSPRPMATFDYAELSRLQRGEEHAAAILLWTLRVGLPLAVYLLLQGGAA